jgi:hypothetical protein
MERDQHVRTKMLTVPQASYIKTGETSLDIRHSHVCDRTSENGNLKSIVVAVAGQHGRHNTRNCAEVRRLTRCPLSVHTSCLERGNGRVIPTRTLRKQAHGTAHFQGLQLVEEGLATAYENPHLCQICHCHVIIDRVIGKVFASLDGHSPSGFDEPACKCLLAKLGRFSCEM